MHSQSSDVVLKPVLVVPLFFGGLGLCLGGLLVLIAGGLENF